MPPTAGQILVNEALPPDLRDYDRPLDKKGLKRLLTQVAQQYPDRYREISKRLNDLGRIVSQRTGGFSFGIEDLETPPEVKAEREKLQQDVRKILSNPDLSPEERDQQIAQAAADRMPAIQQQAYEGARRRGNPFAQQVESGARGSPANLASLLGSDVLYADPEDQPVPLPIGSSYAEGLKPAEYMAGSFGARKGVHAVKAMTAQAGALGKNIQQAAHRLVVTRRGDEEDDPNATSETPRGMPADVSDPDNEGALLAQEHAGYPRNTVVTPEIQRDLQRKGHKRMLLRSPTTSSPPEGGITARDAGVREHGRVPDIGTMTGLVASQSVSEPLSQGQLCLAEGTLVRMADGSSRFIEGIDPGEWVLGADRHGRTFPVEVVHRFYQGRQECHRWRIVPDRGPSATVLATEDHKVAEPYPVADLLITPLRWAPRARLDRGAVDNGRVVRGAAAPRVTRAWDLEVDHPDHLFVLANGLIVSNSAKHSGGVAGQEKAVSGFEHISQLVQSPQRIKGGATHASRDGMVTRVEDAPAGGRYVYVGGEQHHVPQDLPVRVEKGQMVEAGDRLSEGIPSPAEVVRHKGVGEGRRYWAEAMREAMQDAGLGAHRRNTETLARGLIDHVKMREPWGNHLPEDVVSYETVEQEWEPRSGAEEVEPLRAEGKYLEQPALHYTVGTKVRPSVRQELERFGVPRVKAHRDPPPFDPQFISGQQSLQYDPDWMAQMYGSGLQKSLLESARLGATSDERGTSFVPSLARATEFGSPANTIRTPEKSGAVYDDDSGIFDQELEASDPGANLPFEPPESPAQSPADPTTEGGIPSLEDLAQSSILDDLDGQSA